MTKAFSDPKLEALLQAQRRRTAVQPATLQVKNSNLILRVGASLIDTILIVWMGSIFSFILTFLVALPFHSTSPASILALLHGCLAMAYVQGFAYLLWRTLPILPILRIPFLLITNAGFLVLAGVCPLYLRTELLQGPLFQLACGILNFNYCLAPLLISAAYSTFFESSKFRATPGKAIFGLGVATAEGQQLKPHQAFVRFCLSFISTLFLGIGHVFALLPNRATQLYTVASTRLIGAPKQDAELVPVTQNDEILIRYQSFPFLERWLQQRFGGFAVNKLSPKKLALYATAPILACGAFFGSIMVLVRMTGWTLIKKGLEQSSGQFGLGGDDVIRIIGEMVAGVILIAWFFYRSKPSYLKINGSKIALQRAKAEKWGTTDAINWCDLTRIALIQPQNSSDVQDAMLCLHRGDGTALNIKLGSIESLDDRELISRAIDAWAPKVPRDANVVQALQPPADHSYTELWLQALTAAPKRERLKPLIEGALLKNDTYRVIRTLGSGGQGSAYLAEDRVTGTTVVLKEFILPVFVDIGVRKSALQRFEAEARILKQLDHPQIVKLFDFMVEDHRAYLVLEHIDGENLKEIVQRNGKLEEAEVKSLALQMCDILKYMHNLTPPLVHRDFTPDNLILNKQELLKLIDFNVAQNTESTVTGSVVGKHAYLPPEQFRGEFLSQSDIYSMGATLFYLLTGADPEAISESHPRETCPEVSEQIDALVGKATAIDAGLRQENIEQLQQELQSLTPSLNK